MASIAECFSLYSGNTPSRTQKDNFVGELNWISSGELKTHYLDYTGEHISLKVAHENNLRILPVGTFVIAIYGLEAEGVRGTGSIITKESTISQACMAFLPKGPITSEFLYAWYKKHGNLIGIKYAQGTKQQNLGYDIVEKLQLRFPSIAEQKKLELFISLIDQRIETQKKIIDKYESLIKGITDKVFHASNVDFLRHFEMLYKDAGEGGTPSTSNPQYYDNGTIPFIKIDDLSQKYLVAHKDCITQVGLRNSAAWLIPAGSVIYSNGATIGAISINTYPVSTKQGILGIVPNDSVCAEYLYYLMTSKYFRKQVHRIITEGTMKTAYLKDINKILCPVPNMDEQHRLAKSMSSVTRKIETEKATLDAFILQKRYLLSHLFI